jgi:polyhydroxyalkanoate synthesis repressor PhaR
MQHYCIEGPKYMGKSGKGSTENGAVIVKKYANRRLYNTETSSYITLEDLSRMTREGREFKVVDAKTEDDITHTVLTQIIMEEEGRGINMLPAGFLRNIISMYGDSMQAMVPQYLDSAMEAFQRNQAQFRTAIEGALSGGPFEELHKRNMAMLDAATSILRPKGKDGAPSTPPPETGDNTKDAEIAELKAQLAALQSKVEKLG